MVAIVFGSNWSISHVFLMNCRGICCRLRLKAFSVWKFHSLPFAIGAGDWMEINSLTLLKLKWMASAVAGAGFYHPQHTHQGKLKIMTKQKIKYLKWIKIFVVGRKLIENSSLELWLIFLQLALFLLSPPPSTRCDGFFALLLKVSRHRFGCCEICVCQEPRELSRDPGVQLWNAQLTFFYTGAESEHKKQQPSPIVSRRNSNRLSSNFISSIIQSWRFLLFEFALKLNQFHLTRCYHRSD